MPGGLGQGTESLTGVLEATVRDPYRSGPQRQTDQRDHRSQGQHGVGRHPNPFSRPQDVTERATTTDQKPVRPVGVTRHRGAAR